MNLSIPSPFVRIARRSGGDISKPLLRRLGWFLTWPSLVGFIVAPAALIGVWGVIHAAQASPVTLLNAGETFLLAAAMWPLTLVVIAFLLLGPIVLLAMFNGAGLVGAAIVGTGLLCFGLAMTHPVAIAQYWRQFVYDVYLNTLMDVPASAGSSPGQMAWLNRVNAPLGQAAVLYTLDLSGQGADATDRDLDHLLRQPKARWSCANTLVMRALWMCSTERVSPAEASGILATRSDINTRFLRAAVAIREAYREDPDSITRRYLKADSFKAADRLWGGPRDALGETEAYATIPTWGNAGRIGEIYKRLPAPGGRAILETRIPSEWLRKNPRHSYSQAQFDAFWTKVDQDTAMTGCPTCPK